jgi:hypothetical protein
MAFLLITSSVIFNNDGDNGRDDAIFPNSNYLR